MHPSLSYIFIVSNIGMIYCFKLLSGELRGEISIPENSLGIDIDPSGLYLVVASPSRNMEEKTKKNVIEN